jgi:hypothetical protein
MTSVHRRYALVGCGKSKLDRAAPARELYTDPLFRAALALAEAEHAANVWILSAKYGLAFVDEALEPYDLHLGNTTAREREDWAHKVIRFLTDEDEPTRPVHLTVYADSAYVDALRAHLPSTWTLDDPMKGLGQGERLAWLKARLSALTATPAAASSAAPPPSAGPRASPLELSMSTAIPTTLSHQQRSEAFTQALVLEDGLKELESLKARILAGLEKKAESMRQQHARLMRAATTGESPEAPEQLAMPLVEAAAPAQPAVEAPSEKDEEPPPEPPKPKSRTRSRKSTPVQTGEKRAEAPASARTASAAQASALPESEVEDAVPAPRVPCCECSHSVADHKDGTGKCCGKVKGRPCKCRSFIAMAVELPGAPGWKVRPLKGRLSIGEGGEQAYTLIWDRKWRPETPPLWWVPGYGLAFQNGEAVSCVFSYLGMTATTLSYEKDPAWNWVPREVLRALAEYMGATWPAPREETTAVEPPVAEQVPADEQAADEQDGQGLTLDERQVLAAVRENTITRKGAGALLGMGEKLAKLRLDALVCRGLLRQSGRVYVLTKAGVAAIPAEPEGEGESTPCECDGCTKTFKKSELQPVGNAFYCPKCKAEADEQDGKDGDAPAVQAERDVPELDDPFTTAPTDGEAAPEFHALDLTALHPALGKPSAGIVRTYTVRVKGSSPRACEACGTRERPRAFISFDREDRRGKRGQWEGGGGFAMALCLEHCTLKGVERAWPNRHHRVEQERLARQQTETLQDASHEATPAPKPLQTEAPAAPVDLFSQPWPTIDEAHFPGWYVLVCPGFIGKPDSITAGRLHEVYLRLDIKGPEGQDVRDLHWFPAAEGGPRILVGDNSTPALDTIFPAGLYAALVGHLAEKWPAPEVPAVAPAKAKKARVRSKAKVAPPPELTTTQTESAPPAEPSAWRVELPKRNDGHSIIRLWLVNDATKERKAATWWSGVAALRRSHHLAGRLEGESLSAEMELETWWMANADAVVAPLAEACREGRVPGLKVYEPDNFGSGPHKYALSGGWTLEAWEGEGEEAEPSVHFTRPTEQPHTWARFGPFTLDSLMGLLVSNDLEALRWAVENKAVTREAEDFIERGFIFELRQEVAS